MNDFRSNVRVETGPNCQLRDICVGCPGQEIAEILAEDPGSEASRSISQFFNGAFEAAKKAIGDGKRINHKKIDSDMGDYDPNIQDNQKLGKLNRRHVAIMAKNCAIGQAGGGICAFNHEAARQKRLQKTSIDPKDY